MFSLKSLAEYLMWANQVIWDLVSNLTDEEFDRPFGAHVSSIRSRYVHMAEGLHSWIHHWFGDEPDVKPDFKSMKREELYEELTDLNQIIIGMLQNQIGQERELDTKKGAMSFTFEEFFFNLANHATYHRGQIVKGLRLLGVDAVPTDYILYRIDSL
jgi:uncharacterized damage-inducible protein DinB